MTTTARQRKVRRVAAPKAARIQVGDYARVRAAIGIALFVVFFGFVWLVNGHWTASGMAIIGVFFKVQDTSTMYAWGWALHLLITAVEVLPIFILPFVPKDQRWLLVVIWAFSLPFGVFDVLSSAIAIEQLLSQLITNREWLHLISTILAEAVGFLPERVGIPLFLLLHRVLRG